MKAFIPPAATLLPILGGPNIHIIEQLMVKDWEAYRLDVLLELGWTDVVVARFRNKHTGFQLQGVKAPQVRDGPGCQSKRGCLMVFQRLFVIRG